MSARRDPLVVGLELQAELVVEDPQIAVAAAQYRRGHDCLDFLRHHANISLVATVVAEAVEAEAWGVRAKRGSFYSGGLSSLLSQPAILFDFIGSATSAL